VDDLLQALGARVRQLRNERGVSLRVLAGESGVSERFLSDLEAGRGNISVRRLGQVAGALGRSAGALLAEAEGQRKGRPLRVSLLGLRGAGKSTVGPRLASRLQLPFFELDGLVEARAGLSLSEIFALHGEDYYRRLELDVLRAFLAERTSFVLATGGGIVAHAEAYRVLAAQTETVWLAADPDDHWNRVVSQGDVRPMAANPGARAELRRLLRDREPLYRRAKIRVDTTRLGIAGSVDAVERALQD
jgi:XRE family aerobic/anaerobic benzoate catabolism transcriptional regulator